MSKIFRLSLAVSLPFFSYLLLSVYAQEDITITTYYPAPYGVYHRMQSDEATVGENYRDNTPPANGMIIQGRLGVGTPNPGKSLDVNGDAIISGDLVVQKDLIGQLVCTAVDGGEGLGLVVLQHAGVDFM